VRKAVARLRESGSRRAPALLSVKPTRYATLTIASAPRAIRFESIPDFPLRRQKLRGKARGYAVLCWLFSWLVSGV